MPGHYVPHYVRVAEVTGQRLAHSLRQPHLKTLHAGNDGLHVAIRHRRDPINSNRKRMVYLVVLKRDGAEIFREFVQPKDFPTEFLVARLMLIA